MKALLKALPDIARLIGRLITDPRLPRSAKIALVAAAVYLASPVDLLPDFIPFLGYLDDVALAAIVLDGILNYVDRALVLRYWPGTAGSSRPARPRGSPSRPLGALADQGPHLRPPMSMRADYAELIERRLTIPPSEGPDKVMTLEDAVRRFTSPGMTIYIGAAHGRPSALVRELVRQWWGRSPGWTVALTGFGSPATALVLGGLVERLITTFIGEGYPYPTPQPLVGRAVLEGKVAVQNWSMLTLPLRLIAGALGVPFLPTRSLLGSSLEEDNAREGDFLALDDPFLFRRGRHTGAP